jgi:hypothetical protein
LHFLSKLLGGTMKKAMIFGVLMMGVLAFIAADAWAG